MDDEPRGDERKERRREPSSLLPDVVVSPDGPPEKKIRGLAREWSKHGFSAHFTLPFPYEVGEVVDTRCGFRRAHARITWKREIMEKQVLVGFKTPPDY